MLEFVSYEFEPPKYDVDECRQRGMTFAAPLKVTLRLIVFDVDEETGAKSVKDIKEQDVYMGDIPLMTMNGTFIVNGTERVIVSQMHRSPGVFFDHDKGKTHSSGKLLFAARVIPYRGSWLDIEFDAKDIVFARIDRRRKIPVTTLMFALGIDGEEILSTFYEKIIYKRARRTGRLARAVRRRPLPRLQGRQRHGRRRHRRRSCSRPARSSPCAQAKKLAGEGPEGAALSRRRTGRHAISPRSRQHPKTGEIYAEAGEEITEKLLKVLERAGYKELPMLDIDHVNVGAYIRNTLRVDKNMTREDALFDIYRVMRPGEPPTIEAQNDVPVAVLRFSERYDLSAVGRVKMNMRLDLDAPDTCARCARKTSSPSSRRWSTCATARARSTTSTISATAACVRSAS
jgi:DNA-directed RNA polymerase subunit beta